MDKPRLIDANALAAKYPDARDFQRKLREAPTIDAEPVRHGEWDWVTNMMGGRIYSCSQCEEFVYVAMSSNPPEYCHCGAKMDGGG